MTPVEWQAHADVQERLQKRQDQIADFHFSRVCAFIQNWSGFETECMQPVDLMLNPPEVPDNPDRPVQSPEEIRAIYDQLAMDQMTDQARITAERAASQ